MDIENLEENNFVEIKTNKITFKNIIGMIIWLVLLLFIFYQVYILLMYTLGKREKNELWLYNFSNSMMASIFSNDDLQKEEYSLKFAGIGDIYFTSDNLKNIKTKDGYDFFLVTENIYKKLSEYDLVLASLKTPIVDNDIVYSNNDIYSAPINLTEMLKKINISVVTTATSHAYDKKELGINQTIENLNMVQIEQTGISNNGNRSKPVIVAKKNINIGILSYTTASNVKISKDNKYMVNIFNETDAKSDIEYLNSQNVDFIIAYLNIPNENNLLVSSKQKNITESLFELGANVVLGSGSMIVQEIVDEETEDGNHVYAAYSLGDFCGSFETKDNLLNIIANIEFKKSVKKDKEGNITNIEKNMIINESMAVYNILDNKGKNTMYFLDELIEDYENGNIKIDEKEYQNIKEADKKINEIFI